MEKNKASQDSIKILNRRSFIITTIGLILSLIVSIRLFSLQILNFNFYQKKSVENKVAVKATPPLRGDIFDNEKNLVAANASLYEFVIYKNLNKNYMDEVSNLNKLINLDLKISNISEKLKSFNAYTPFILSRANWQQIVEFEKNKFLFTSIKIIESKKRYYPHKNLSQIIGYMGQSSDDKYLYPKGVFHLEKTYDELLKGKPGKIFNEVNSRGKVIREISIEEPIKGNSLELTINLKLQNYAQSVLPLSNKGSIVVINRFDGSILSMNSNPTYDAQVFEDRDNETINSLLNDPEKPLLNRAFTGFYPPGSVFKPIPALLGLKKNMINEKTEVFCSGSTSLADRNYYCWKKGGHGKVNLKKAIKESCDCYFYELAKKINIDDLSELATNLGLNNTYKIGLSNAQKGLIPNKKWKKSNLEQGWYQGETLITSIGQGYNLTSPLQLATLYSALLNGGRFPSPKLIKNEPSKYLGEELNSNHQKAILNALKAAVQEPSGTAYKLNLDNPNFVKIGGKTGTSQVVRIKEEDREDDLYKTKEIEDKFKDHSVFVGYAPIDEPKYIASVIIENGGSGSAVAAPIAHNVLNFAYQENV
ncbi:peptidoglycan glycosyltransferase [alpha proteobacterium HIMB59]|nr:peptidoglycan glycosyltransferase [alpha proteobacterium HIMB59]